MTHRSLLIDKVLTVLADRSCVKMPCPIPLPGRFVTIRWVAVAVVSAILMDSPIQREFVQIELIEGGINQLILDDSPVVNTAQELAVQQMANGL